MYGPLEVNVSTRALAFPSPNQTKSGFDFAEKNSGRYTNIITGRDISVGDLKRLSN